jgi:hypothetical protein
MMIRIEMDKDFFSSYSTVIPLLAWPGTAIVWNPLTGSLQSDSVDLIFEAVTNLSCL